ncbi:MAG TPA: DUF1015 domain-containing protein [Anaerolineae bacterium]
MATIRPFRGIRYNTAKINDLSQVITQPYDRINKAQQAAYYAQSPYNFVRIDYGQTAPDLPTDNVYTRARDYAAAWLQEGVLQREGTPALYVLEQTYTTPDGQTRTRRGFTAALQLTPFEEGTILPHQRTFSAPKSDRLNLTRATQMATGQILILYPDAANRINALLQPFVECAPSQTAHELGIEPAVTQRFWVLDDPALIAQITEEMAPKRNLVIADGHHRYETALAYREEMRAQNPSAPADAAFNYALITFVSMSDPGLVILPTHRLVRDYIQQTNRPVLAAAQDYFDVQPMVSRTKLEAALRSATPDHPSFGFYDGGYTLLTLHSLDVMNALAPDHAPAWRRLDVAVLHKLLLEHICGLGTGGGHDDDSISYLRDVNAGYAAVERGEANFLFVLNPTRMEQVNACTQIGEKMPQKSTDFFPKVISGLVALPLSGTIGD